MGYTHYFSRQKSEIPQELWDYFTNKLKPILKAHSDILTDVEVTRERVFFNGVPDHETLVIERVATERSWSNEFFAFCKTACKPYDKVVVAALILLATITRDDPCQFTWSSDGGPGDHEEGLALTGLGAEAVGIEVEL